MDEDALDDDMETVEQAADDHSVTPADLINDDSPTEVGNPPLKWSDLFAGDIVKLPTGQVDDEGFFSLPTNPVGKNGSFTVADFIAGTVPQADLDEVQDVMPLRNQDLVDLVGRCFVAVVYDSDISINYEPLEANLQGGRLGLFYFTVLAVEVAGPQPSGVDFPGSLPESRSDRSLYDIWIRVEDNTFTDAPAYQVDVRDHEPSSPQITSATQGTDGTLTVFAEAGSFEGVAVAPADDGIAYMTLSLEADDDGTDPNEDPLILEAQMTYNVAQSRYEFTTILTENVAGRRLSIQDDEGGAYNVLVSGPGLSTTSLADTQETGGTLRTDVECGCGNKLFSDTSIASNDGEENDLLGSSNTDRMG
jgi:hypothetical protein